MRQVLLPGLSALLIGAVIACSSTPSLPVYEISWDGCIQPSLCKGAAVKAYVWGSPNLQERPNFTSKGVLVRAGISPPWNNLQYYNPAFESYGCFPEERSPKTRGLYFANENTTVPVKTSELSVARLPQQIPIEIQVKPLDAATQEKIKKGIQSGAPIQTFGGLSCMNAGSN